MVAVREVVGDRPEQPRTLGVRSAEGGETGDGHTSALLQVLLTSYYCVVPVSYCTSPRGNLKGRPTRLIVPGHSSVIDRLQKKGRLQLCTVSVCCTM